MFNEWKWYEMILLVFWMFVANVIAFPCFILQRLHIKAKLYANWLHKKGFDELTFYDIYFFKEH